MIKKEYPELCEKYVEKREKNKENPRMTNASKKKKNKKETFEESILDTLPKKIRYGDFLDFMCKCNTGNFTGSELVEIATKRGIKVII